MPRRARILLGRKAELFALTKLKETAKKVEDDIEGTLNY